MDGGNDSLGRGQEQTGVQGQQTLGQDGVKAQDLEKGRQIMISLAAEDPVAVTEVWEERRDKGTEQNKAYGEDWNLPMKLPYCACW